MQKKISPNGEDVRGLKPMVPGSHRLQRAKVRPVVKFDREKEPSRTKQMFKAECDINNIMKKALATGQLPEMIKQNPQFGDFSDVATYQESLNVINFAHEQFEALSAQVRARFHNDPQEFLAFVEKAENQQELIKMGLATPKPQPDDQKPAKGGSKKSGSASGAPEPAAGGGPDA